MPPYGVGALAMDYYGKMQSGDFSESYYSDIREDVKRNKEIGPSYFSGDQTAFQIHRPTQEDETLADATNWIINGPITVPSGSFGTGYMDYPTVALWNTRDFPDYDLLQGQTAVSFSPLWRYNVRADQWYLVGSAYGPLQHIGWPNVASEGADSQFTGRANAQGMAYAVVNTVRIPAIQTASFIMGEQGSGLTIQEAMTRATTVQPGDFVPLTFNGGGQWFSPILFPDGVARDNPLILLAANNIYRVDFAVSVEATTATVADHDKLQILACVLAYPGQDEPELFTTSFLHGTIHGAGYPNFIAASRKSLIVQDTGYLTAKTAREQLATSAVFSMPSYPDRELGPLSLGLVNFSERPIKLYHGSVVVQRTTRSFPEQNGNPLYFYGGVAL
jgi:hypothetical protein